MTTQDKPLDEDPPLLLLARKAVAEKQFQEFIPPGTDSPVVLDIFSASAILTVHDGLNEVNREKYRGILREDPVKAVLLAFKVVK